MQHALQACDIIDAFTDQMVTLCDVNESHNRQSKVMQRSAVACLRAREAAARLPSNRPQPIAGGGFMHVQTHYIIIASHLLRGQNINSCCCGTGSDGDNGKGER